MNSEPSDENDSRGSDGEGVEYGLEEWGRDTDDEDGAFSSVTDSLDFGSGTTSHEGGRTARVSVAAGTVVAFLLSQWIPIVGVAAGGALAGNLRGEGRKTGAMLGAVVGVLQAIPDLLLGLLFGIGGLDGFLLPVVTGQASAGETILGLLFAVLLAAIYFGVGALAGAVGGYFGGNASPLQVHDD